MPRILGLNLLGVVLASIVFFMVGFVFYGVLFSETWMEFSNVTEADFEGQNTAPYMAGGFLITVLQVIGIGLVMRWRGVKSIGGAVSTALILWALFAVPFIHYAYLYMPQHHVAQLLVDGGHFLVGWLVSAIILAVLK